MHCARRVHQAGCAAALVKPGTPGKMPRGSKVIHARNVPIRKSPRKRTLESRRKPPLGRCSLDYQSASPERRPDLDLTDAPLPSGLRSPLAVAFYWVRWLPRGERPCRCSCPGSRKRGAWICRWSLSRHLAAPCGKRPRVTRRSVRSRSLSRRPRSLRTGICCVLRSTCMDRADRGGD
jgi:hypothetical protein